MAIRKPASGKPARERRAKRATTNIWEELAELGRQIPDEELAKLPRDLARNFDHYLDGSPKQD
jgi:hypothetical protein